MKEDAAEGDVLLLAEAEVVEVGGERPILILPVVEGNNVVDQPLEEEADLRQPLARGMVGDGVYEKPRAPPCRQRSERVGEKVVPGVWASLLQAGLRRGVDHGKEEGGAYGEPARTGGPGGEADEDKV